MHAAAWADTLDDFLVELAGSDRHEFVPFDRRHEYKLLMAGRPRLEGVRAFLARRGIRLPGGARTIRPAPTPSTDSRTGRTNGCSAACGSEP